MKSSDTSIQLMKVEEVHIFLRLNHEVVIGASIICIVFVVLGDLVHI